MGGGLWCPLTQSVGVASVPLSPPSNNRLPPCPQTPQTSLSGLALPMVSGTPQCASQHMNILPSPTSSIPRTTHGNVNETVIFPFTENTISQ